MVRSSIYTGNRPAAFRYHGCAPNSRACLTRTAHWAMRRMQGWQRPGAAWKWKHAAAVSRMRTTGWAAWAGMGGCGGLEAVAAAHLRIANSNVAQAPLAAVTDTRCTHRSSATCRGGHVRSNSMLARQNESLPRKVSEQISSPTHRTTPSSESCNSRPVILIAGMEPAENAVDMHAGSRGGKGSVGAERPPPPPQRPGVGWGGGPATQRWGARPGCPAAARRAAH